MTDTATYDDEEVQEILRRALEENSGLGHAELAAAAAEVGIDRDRFERAAKAVRGERSRAGAIERRKAKRRKKLIQTGASFAVINLFLFAIDMLSGGGWWFQWPLVSMAFVYALQWVKHFGADDEAAVIKEEAKRAKQMRKRNRKERRRQRAIDRAQRKQRGKARLQDAEDAFEAAVEQGLSKLFESIAGGIESLSTSGSGGEFGEFVARKEGRPAPTRAEREAPPASGPQVRIDASEEAEREAEIREAMAEIERELGR
ncbi:MAG: 2TM domain-containing protein [Deltaproteobacteria bacterium]|nr:2TM domain-containing protein [Deltaproteobacteria bacterium]